LQRSIIAPAERVTNLRWGMVSILAFGVLAAYFCVAVTSVEHVRHAFGFDASALRSLFGQAKWSFIIGTAIAGPMLDRFGVVPLGRAATLGAILFSVLLAFAGPFGMVAAGIIGVHLLWAWLAPGTGKAIAYWFPLNERTSAMAILQGAAMLGVALGLPAAYVAARHFGWLGSALAASAVAGVFLIVFFAFYRDPENDARLTHAERMHIENGGAQAAGPPAGGPPVPGFVARVLAQRNVWGTMIGFAAQQLAFFALLGRLFRRMNGAGIDGGHHFIAVGVVWVIAIAAVICIGGFGVDARLSRGGDPTRVRKTMLVAGLVCGLIGAAGAIVPDARIGVVLVALGLIGLATSAPVALSLPGLIAARGTVGTVAGLTAFAAALALALVPRTLWFGNATQTLLLVAVPAVVGAVSYSLILGRIEPPADSLSL
jgi:ACS family D-galactonate transporter-like MFS transporter